MGHSFRLKIALLSGLITGLLLVGTGLVLWRAAYRFNLDRVDRELRNLGQANLERVVGGDHWARLEDALKFVSGRPDSTGFILWVKNYEQEVYRSRDWPADLAPESLPAPAAYETPGGPRPDEPPPPPPRRGEEISPRNPALPRKAAEFHTRRAGGRTWRLGVMGNPYVVFVLGANLDEFDARMAEFRNTLLAALPCALVLAGLGAWFLAQRALRPVTALTETARHVTARGLDQRIPAMARDQEFNRLVTVFNEMLDRLETSFRQATRFSADASHELKTPLARLQVELEQAVQDAPAGSPQLEVYSSLLDEISRLKAIVQKLLLLSLVDAGRLQLAGTSVNLTRVLEAVIEDCRAGAPGLSVDCDLTPGIEVQADADLLEQALQNLASNAVKYNQPGGRIQFRLAREGPRACLRVANTGPGIPPVDRARVFERFYRADQSRSHRVEGVGLGLSLSREIFRAHGGDLALAPEEEALTVFTAWLPATS